MVAKVPSPKIKGGKLEVWGLDGVVVDPGVRTSFTFTLGTPADAQEVVAAFCQQYGYPPKVANPEPQRTVKDSEGNETLDPAWKPQIDNPVTPEDWATVKIAQYISAVVQGYRAAAAQAAAAAAVAKQPQPDVNVS